MAFKLGEIVQLKSGGPKMTVISLPGGPYGGGYYGTTWFAGAKKESGNFPAEALVTPKEEDKK
jgi:uncharacterized protein YodC (DUF2158 family)